jgi:hypothetical protein
MDDFISKQPYRCLPLLIANTSGWDILTPSPFRATWNGDPNRHVLIESPLNAAPNAHEYFVSSLFGGGTITFHPGWLFQTEPGWDLWVGGAPNSIKHGIQALTGVVETSWLPFPFTMNWRFSAPGSVEFAAGEPFCFVAPTPHTALDTCEPIIKKFEDAPEMKAKADAWRADREKFMAEAAGKTGEEGWGRHYFRGVYPDGSPGPDDHIHKRRLKPLRPARADE